MGDQNISEDAVVKATGAPRDAWFVRMDGLGLSDMDHTARVRALHAEHPELSGWWAQMLTVEYERAKGLRVVGETCAGDFQVSVSKTLAMPLDAAWDRLVSQPFLPGSRWEEGAEVDIAAEAAGTQAPVHVQVRRADPGKMLRWFWHDANGKSTVEVHFQDKGDKTTLTIRHHQLADETAREWARARWKDALALIAQ